MTDTTIWIITAAAVIVLVIFFYRGGIGLSFKGWGVQGSLQAKATEAAKAPPGSRNVSIGRDATGNLIVTGDGAAGNKAAAGAGRNVSIGGNAGGNTIVTGDGNKVG